MGKVMESGDHFTVGNKCFAEKVRNMLRTALWRQTARPAESPIQSRDEGDRVCFKGGVAFADCSFTMSRVTVG